MIIFLYARKEMYRIALYSTVWVAFNRGPIRRFERTVIYQRAEPARKSHLNCRDGDGLCRIRIRHAKTNLFETAEEIMIGITGEARDRRYYIVIRRSGIDRKHYT